MRLPALALFLTSCATFDPIPERIAFAVPADEVAATQAFLSTIGDARLEAIAQTEGTPRGALRVAMEQDDGRCGECFRIDRGDVNLEVQAGGQLGRLYAASTVLEAFGYRFHHPHDTWAPTVLVLSDADTGFGVDEAPDIPRRGIHLHTLHPTDGMMDAWMPSKDGQARMAAVVDWIIRHRGNHLQWVALEDIVVDAGAHARWEAHTQAILADAHAKGITVGVGIQLFGSGNLQLAFDLVDDATTPEAMRAEMGPRLDLLTDNLDFDLFNLSFGEFFGEDPEAFIASVEMAYDEIIAREPEAAVTTVLHAGDDLQVDYNDTTQIYYFLATYADRPITHWAHTVMYYNLFEDAGGAYHHADFAQHRDYVVNQLKAKQPVGYFPESAYWIAFDNSVPQYLPLYQRTRWTDLSELARVAPQAPVSDHVLFSSGWEWGHWQHDVAFLRNSYTLAADWCAPLRHELAPHGDYALALADVVCDLGELQHDYLIVRRLTPYLASYDNIMELGYGLDIVSQPRRRLFPQIVAYTEGELAAYDTEVIGLENYAAALADLLGDLANATPSEPDRYEQELLDGVRISEARARFAWHLARAVSPSTGDRRTEIALEAADAALADARAIVDTRHAALHDPEPARLLTKADNPTLYDFGYLLRAEELCFWERERMQAANALVAVDRLPAEAAMGPVPGCGL